MENKAFSSTLHVRIKTHDALLFEGDAKSVTTGNERGMFDILPEHENFISIITKDVGLTLMDNDHKDFVLPFGSGLMRVFENTISIYLGVNKPQTQTPLNKLKSLLKR